MVSQADTLKIARADITIIGNRIVDAQQGHVFGMPDPRVSVRRAVQMMEQTARRLRWSFRVED